VPGSATWVVQTMVSLYDEFSTKTFLKLIFYQKEM